MTGSTPSPAPVVVRNGRSPFEFALVTVSLVSGVVGLSLSEDASSSIAQVFGHHAVWFYAAMAASSLLVPVGMLWPRTDSSRFRLALEIERIGLWPLGGATFAYSAALLVVTGRGGLIAGLLTLGIGVASFVRIWIIFVDLRRVEHLLMNEVSRGRCS